jgi:hypothetical protein
MGRESGTVGVEQLEGLKTAWATLLNAKNEEARELTSYCIRGFVLYVVIVGGLAKFALDTSATTELRVALSVFGTAVAILGLLCCVFAERVRRAIERDLRQVTDELAVPTLTSGLLPTRYIGIVGTVFAGLTFFGWIYVLIKT